PIIGHHAPRELQEALLEDALPPIARDDRPVVGNAVEAGRHDLGRNALRHGLLAECGEPGGKAAPVPAAALRLRWRCTGQRKAKHRNGGDGRRLHLSRDIPERLWHRSPPPRRERCYGLMRPAPRHRSAHGGADHACWMAESSHGPPRLRRNVHSSVASTGSLVLPSTTAPLVRSAL